MSFVMFALALVGMFPWLVFGTGILYLGLRFVRAVEARKATTGELAETKQRVLELEGSLDDMAREVTRLGESNQFISKLLEERTASTFPLKRD
jgi:hypothetical protein